MVISIAEVLLYHTSNVCNNTNKTHTSFQMLILEKIDHISFLSANSSSGKKQGSQRGQASLSPLTSSCSFWCSKTRRYNPASAPGSLYRTNRAWWKLKEPQGGLLIVWRITLTGFFQCIEPTDLQHFKPVLDYKASMNTITGIHRSFVLWSYPSLQLCATQ